MLKALRMVKEKVAGPVGEGDKEDHDRVKAIQDATAALHRTMGLFFKVQADQNATTAALHEDLANLYPAGQQLSTAVAQLNASSAGQLFQDTGAMLAEMKALLEPPIDRILARTRELLTLIEERRVLRSEVEHYKDKVTRLANDGLADAKKQAKAESNQGKLLANQKRMRELEAILGHALPQLDAEICGHVDRAIAGYVQAQANHASQLLHVYGSAIAAVPGAMRAPGGGPAAGVLQPSQANPPAGGASSESAASNSGAGATAAAPKAVEAEPAASMSDFLGGGGSAEAVAAAPPGGGDEDAAPPATEAEPEGGDEEGAPKKEGGNPFDF